MKSTKHFNLFRFVFGKTLDQWSQKFKVKIQDPDGFDRNDINLYNRKFYRKEFEKGLWVSTIQISKDSKLLKAVKND